MNLSQCPCGHKQSYQNCCEPIHQDASLAHHPEQLMRARYSAHVLGMVDFIIQTYHPSCQAEKARQAIQDFVQLQWLGLEVLQSSVSSNGHEGYVEFKAFYQEDQQTHCLHEKSRFIHEINQEKNNWYYVDGVYPQAEKLGRNDPCFCGSGKKYKKCCG